MLQETEIISLIPPLSAPDMQLQLCVPNNDSSDLELLLKVFLIRQARRRGTGRRNALKRSPRRLVTLVTKSDTLFVSSRLVCHFECERQFSPLPSLLLSPSFLSLAVPILPQQRRVNWRRIQRRRPRVWAGMLHLRPDWPCVSILPTGRPNK